MYFPVYIKFSNLLFFSLDNVLQTSFLITIGAPIYGGTEFHYMGCAIVSPAKLLLHI